MSGPLLHTHSRVLTTSLTIVHSAQGYKGRTFVWVVSSIPWQWVDVCMSSLCLLLTSAGAQTSSCRPVACTLSADSDLHAFVHPSFSLPSLFFLFFPFRPERMHDQQRRLLPRLHGPTNRLRVPVPCGIPAPGQKDLWR